MHTANSINDEYIQLLEIEVGVLNLDWGPMSRLIAIETAYGQLGEKQLQLPERHQTSVWNQSDSEIGHHLDVKM